MFIGAEEVEWCAHIRSLVSVCYTSESREGVLDVIFLRVLLSDTSWVPARSWGGELDDLHQAVSRGSPRQTSCLLPYPLRIVGHT